MNGRAADGDRHQLPVETQVIQLATVAPPLRLDSTICADLPLAAAGIGNVWTTIRYVPDLLVEDATKSLFGDTRAWNLSNPVSSRGAGFRSPNVGNTHVS